VTPGGYCGRFLRADLGAGRFVFEPLADDVLRRFVGGSGLGTWLLANASPAGVEPFAPEAGLVIALSPLVGTPLTTSAKFAVVAKSPLTDRVCDALASDRFAIELKRAGMDALVLVGACAEWSLLVIDDGRVRLESAADLVGMSSAAAEERVRERLGDAFRFFGIGPAGERLVRYATASGDGRHAGRGGLGAVFGSKRLKGVAVRGTQAVPVADAARVLALAKDLSARSLGPGTAKYRDLGTVANLLVFNRLSALPTRNFQTGSFEGAEAVSGEAMHALPSVRKFCASCTIGCEHVFQQSDGKPVRLEYEGLFALGPLCGIADRDAVLRAAAKCDELGLDVISAGGTIAFAMECGERGWLDGAPRFGDAAGLLRLLDDIAARRGLGVLLAEGSRRAAASIGGGAPRIAAHVKGLEMPGYEPRALKAMALGLAVSSRGADHNRSGAYEEDFRPGADRLDADASKGPAAMESEVRSAVLDSLIVCKFLRGVFGDLMAEGAEMLAAVTGWDVTAAELRETGERIVTAKKLFNVREGWTRAEDTLPARFLDEPLGGAPSGFRLSRIELDRMIASYYRAHGWTSGGDVPDDRAAALGLHDLRTPRGSRS
jgi:aldehyde:ferredoxin oxidoreductase